MNTCAVNLKMPIPTKELYTRMNLFGMQNLCYLKLTKELKKANKDYHFHFRMHWLVQFSCFIFSNSTFQIFFLKHTLS